MTSLVLFYSLLVLGLTSFCSCAEAMVKQAGTDLSLTCSLDGDIILWEVNGNTVNSSSTGGSGSKIISTLERKNLTTEDAGLYQCLAKEDMSVIESFNITILSISGMSQNLVNNMSMAELSCAVTNTVVFSELQWKRDGMVLNTTDKYTVEANDSATSLAIHMPDDEDAGLYTCVVMVDAKEFEQNVSLNTKPTVQPIEKLRSKVEGEMVTIVCHVTGYPTPDITWYLSLEGEEGMKEVTRGNTSAQDGVPNAVLIITKLKIKLDRGDYTCVASNFLGSANSTITLKVKDKLAAVWPFLGICAEVAILCSIIFIFEKRRNRRMEEEEEVDAVKQDLMNKSNGADEKEVRQRSNATKA